MIINGKYLHELTRIGPNPELGEVHCFAELHSQWRTRAGMTTRALADKVGLDSIWIDKLENIYEPFPERFPVDYDLNNLTGALNLSDDEVDAFARSANLFVQPPIPRLYLANKIDGRTMEALAICDWGDTGKVSAEVWKNRGEAMTATLQCSDRVKAKVALQSDSSERSDGR